MFRIDSTGAPLALAGAGALDLRVAATGQRATSNVSMSLDGVRNAPAADVPGKRLPPRPLAAALAWHQDHARLSGRMQLSGYCKLVKSGSAPLNYVRADGNPTALGEQRFKHISPELQAAADALRADYPDVFRSDGTWLPRLTGIAAATVWTQDASLRARMTLTQYARAVGLPPISVRCYIKRDGMPNERLESAVNKMQAKYPQRLQDDVRALRDQYPEVFQPPVPAPAAPPAAPPAVWQPWV